ncbi:MAG: hypothetical protein NPIRA04_00690 [Nitrospirales bacterium]|nr:MAG: hypothetical protein NPIRA04_00690 [Nitrospirales bacterium]
MFQEFNSKNKSHTRREKKRAALKKMEYVGSGCKEIMGLQQRNPSIWILRSRWNGVKVIAKRREE